MSFKVGDSVTWKWMGGVISGSVEEVHLEKITKKIKGKNITRNGSPEKPAYLVKSEAGNFALKLITELSKKSGTSRPKPIKTQFDD